MSDVARATTLVLLALVPAAVLATVATPTASAYPECLPTDPDCEVVEFRDCPSGTYGPHVYVMGREVTSCWW